MARSGSRINRLKQRDKESAEITMTAGSAIASPYQPLSQDAVQKIHNAALQILAETGMAKATPRVLETALSNGCQLSDSGRLLFPNAVIEKTLKAAAKNFVMHGRDATYDFVAKNDRINFCTGGAAVTMLDIDTQKYRPSTTKDLYDLSRLADKMQNIQWFTRPIVLTDIEDPYELDVNTIYACAAGTKKHIATSFTQGAHVYRVLPLLDHLAGGSGSFAKRPFCTVHATTVVSPLNFAEDSLDVACAAIDIGMPIHLQTGPQAGATAPAALAGTLVQVCAESLASLAVVNMIKPGHPVVLGTWVMVSDLRTGAFSGGGGEQALLGAAAGQMIRHYGVPGGMGAGMTDSKLPDNQAGFEKALTVAMAALSGPGFVMESAGMLASLLGCSLEAMVIDNDMLSNIRRIGRGIEVNEETLSVDVIKSTVEGPGHFLGSQQTMKLMKTEYVYPEQADRSSAADWQDAGSEDMWHRAGEFAREVLASHQPVYIDSEADSKIRAEYPISLNII
jgi:trimethylamine--corrinoid protein Co-methyltransferase